MGDQGYEMAVGGVSVAFASPTDVILLVVPNAACLKYNCVSNGSEAAKDVIFMGPTYSL